jgi:hypothetical protein
MAEGAFAPRGPAPAPAPSTPTRAPRPAAPTLAGPAATGLRPPVGSLRGPSGPGQRLTPAVAGPITASLGIDVSAVRVHSDARAGEAAALLSARAFTVGNDVFLGRGESSTDLPLLAHEVAHAVQQQGGGAAPQPWHAGGGDRFEHEAQRASAAVTRGATFTVGERTAPRVQRLGISDALDYFADKANLIPGFRMFTIVLGVNPINMSRADRSAANILRAIVEFIPGGALITQALDNHGIFEKVGSWVEQQIGTLGVTLGAIKTAISTFLDSLGWRDIFDLGGVWDRAKRIFTEPITRIITFAKGLITGIIGFIKDAILLPLAKLAEGTRGWDLLIAVLQKNPITGERVPRTAETLVPGFLKLIGQEEVWTNMKKANAIPRAWAWFQGALTELLAFVSQIPTLAIDTFKSLELMDIIVLPRAFAKVATAFGGFIGSFIGWVGKTVWNLLEIVFDVVSPGAWGYIKKTGAALKSILRNPLPFMGNLVKAGKLGFQNFAGNFPEHLKAGLIDWLTGSLPGVYIPKSFSLQEVVKFALSVLGLSWQNVRQKLVKVVGEPVVAAMEAGFDIVVTLVREGPAAAWEKLKENLSNLKDTVIGGIIDMVVGLIVTKAVPKLIAMFIPGAGFISAILTIYDTIMVFVQKLAKIAQVVKGFVDSIVSIAAGVIGAAAKRVEGTLAGLLSLAISFLAGFAGLGKVADKVMGVINKVRAPIDKALDAVITWIVTMAKKLFAKVFGKAEKDGADPEKERKLAAGLAAIEREDAALAKDGKILREDAESVAQKVRKEHPVFTSLTVVDGGARWDFDYTASPGKKTPGKPKKPTGATKSDPIELTWIKPAIASYPRIRLAPPDKVADRRDALGVRRLASSDVAKIAGSFTVGPTGSRSLDGKAIGVTNASSQIKPDFVVQAQAQVSGNSQKDSFNSLVERWGYNRDEGPTDGDHVLEKQLGGPDAYDNVWPLDSGTNRSSGGHVRGEISRIKTDYKLKTIVGKWFKLKL